MDYVGIRDGIISISLIYGVMKLANISDYLRDIRNSIEKINQRENRLNKLEKTSSG